MDDGDADPTASSSPNSDLMMDGSIHARTVAPIETINPQQATTIIPATATESAAATEAQLKKWFPLYKPLASPRLRILCFPNAGSAENIYTGMANRNKQRCAHALDCASWINYGVGG